MASSSSSATTIQMQMDLDSDGLIDTSAPSNESITYAWTSGTKQITRRQGVGTAQVLADNIESMGLVFEGPLPTNGVCTGAWGAIIPRTRQPRLHSAGHHQSGCPRDGRHVQGERQRDGPPDAPNTVDLRTR